jgi:hypothetical protein
MKGFFQLACVLAVPAGVHAARGESLTRAENGGAYARGDMPRSTISTGFSHNKSHLVGAPDPVQNQYGDLGGAARRRLPNSTRLERCMSQYFALYSLIFMIAFVGLFDCMHLDKKNARFLKNGLLSSEELGQLRRILVACQEE